nr:hypothetical protein Iba_chr10dCG7020 [Ipomoea batatas]
MGLMLFMDTTMSIMLPFSHIILALELLGILNFCEGLGMLRPLKPEPQGFLMSLLLALQFVEILDGVGVTKVIVKIRRLFKR